MILVIGNNPRKVIFNDLKDCIYYKQKKVFSDAEYARSADLQAAIKQGSVTILEQKPDRDGRFSVDTPSSGDFSGDRKIDDLLERLKNIEGVLQDVRNIPAVDQKSISEDIVRKISDIEARLDRKSEEKPGNETLSSLIDLVKKLEERLDDKLKQDEFLKRIELLLSRGIQPVSSNKPDVLEIQEEKYIPTISVEDAKSHVKLDVRTIETIDDVSESLRKLKELKSKSK